MITWVVASNIAEAQRNARSGPSYWRTGKERAQEIADRYTAEDECTPHCVYHVYRVTLTVELEKEGS